MARLANIPLGLRTFLLGVVVVVGLFVINSRYPTLLATVELKANDLRLYTRGTKKPAGVVVIAAIDDKSIEQLGRWPWPRSVLAKLVDALKDYRVRVIGFDMVFSEQDDADHARGALVKRLLGSGLSAQKIETALGPGNDDSFANAIEGEGNVILGYPLEVADPHNHGAIKPGFIPHFRQPYPLSFGLVRTAAGPAPSLMSADGYLPNIPVIANAAHGAAYIDTPTDSDGVFRSEAMVIKFGSHYCEPLVLAVTSAYAKGALTTLSLANFGVAGISIGPEQLPVDEGGRMLVNFRGPAHTFPYYSVSDIIAHRVPPQDLAGRLVLVGATALGVGDRWSTPMGANFPGVEIHANAIDDILTGDFIRQSDVTAGAERVAAGFIGLAVSAAVALLSPVWSAVAAAMLFLGYFMLAQHLLNADGMLVGVVFPAIVAAITYAGLAAYRYLTEGREKRFLRRAFEYYLHPEVISSIVRNPKGLALGGDRRHMSILFADIKNFTSRAEVTPPEELTALLNTYMTAMIDVILGNGGVVDKLMGDGIMAFWGAPSRQENPSLLAIKCALGMLAALQKLRDTKPAFSNLDIGVGIATGDAVVGNFGGRQRFDYSVLGDTVNLASRIEGLTRYFNVHLLVNDHALTEAGDGFVSRPMGLVRVKGKHEAVKVMEVAGQTEDNIDQAFYHQFTAAVDMLGTDSHLKGVQALREMAEHHPNDHPLQLYLERTQPAAENQNGVGGGPLEGLLRRFRKKPQTNLPATVQPIVFELETK